LSPDNLSSTSLPSYRGRFAPSPTGPLHFGSLVAAVGSYLDARHQHGHWYLRIEDLDPPRIVPGAADDILRTLDKFGLHWDESVMYQSNRQNAYNEALAQLDHDGYVYACTCTRREIAGIAIAGVDTPVYPGTCRQGADTSKEIRSIRVRTVDDPVSVNDMLQGVSSQVLSRDVGDFVVKRADGLFAYQLAVVVDDAYQTITDVVRGADLLNSTPRQIYCQQLLGLPTPNYAHLPVIVDDQGDKLSKQSSATPVQTDNPVPALWKALDSLGQQPPRDLLQSDLDSFWQWAILHWTMSKVPARLTSPTI